MLTASAIALECAFDSSRSIISGSGIAEFMARFLASETAFRSSVGIVTGVGYAIAIARLNAPVVAVAISDAYFTSSISSTSASRIMPLS